ncbi:MAG: Gfo/Idh/MocA family oxidoreductase [Bacteroidales bacterium]|nr:Gfo/Idh/MocA family oxidoreductase [Bacteroidales bacterium]MDP3002731.1 Gfo/Idh/MocA family oxidoreductase [Bacteroidales bacterium]
MNVRSSKKKSRREFISTSAAAVAGLTILPGHVIPGFGHIAPSDKLNIAGVGIGGMGKGNLANVAKTENIIALCDVDWREQTTKVFETYPGARQYKDYRIMLDKQKDIDAVIVATPDHTHAVISLEAIRRGKHVFTQKPLTHTVHEARVLTKAAREYKVATQMGNQGQASDGPRRLREMIWDGVIGPVREVHVWTDRPNNGLFKTYWPQGINKPEDTHPVPEKLDWDLFVGPAPMRPYHPAYHPFRWRGWLNFGTGALGDIGCHSLDPVFRALKLQYPTSVQAVSTLVNEESYPLASMVRYEFPSRGDLPPVSLLWYDGGLRPMQIPELEDGMQMGPGGVLYIGDKGKILGDRILPASLRNSYQAPEPYIPSSPGHEQEWIEACKGGDPAGSNFDWAGPLTETVLLGNIALRKELKEKLSGQRLKFNPEKFSFPDMPEADQFLHYLYREGWNL